MTNIKWCLKQSKGIMLVEQNIILCQQYLKNCDDDLLMMLKAEGKWKNITAYYACYEALYAILQRIGVKCEIHGCSIELMNLIKDFTKDEIQFMATLKKERIDVQYYLKAPEAIDEKRIKEFILKCKIIINNIDEKKILEIRASIKQLK